MFAPSTYLDRRNTLMDTIDDGLILIPGSSLRPRNYEDNVYPFRQSSHFLYYAAVSEPDLFVVLDPRKRRTVLYGRPRTMDDVVWCGERPDLAEYAAMAGIREVAPLDELRPTLTAASQDGVTLHYLPPYHAAATLALAQLLDRSPDAIGTGSSARLVRAVVEQRLVKSDEEIGEIEAALAVTARAYAEVMRQARPGLLESDIDGILQGIALRHNCAQSFPPITSIRGEVLHNDSRGNTLQEGQLLVVDSGAEVPSGYASDITRTMPVSGRFDPRQRDIYQVVLEAHDEAIAAIRPGIRYTHVHRRAARIVARGLTDIGLMRGNPEDAVAAGAHALFFPHGLGHALGIDVHDMEDLGDAVGYGRDLTRSPQFGLNFLRFARVLAPGHVLTAEPGVYFIPALIDRWAGEGKLAEFIDYDAAASYKGFGGIRIEDDVLVTEDGGRILGPGIPASVDDVEAAMAG